MTGGGSAEDLAVDHDRSVVDGQGSPPPGWWEPRLTSRDLSVERIQDIVFTPMSDRRRDGLVTLAHRDLAAAMGAVLGTPQPNWCSYAQWPSTALRRSWRAPVPGVASAVQRAVWASRRNVLADVGQAYVAFLETVGAAAPRTLDEVISSMTRCMDRLDAMRRPPGPIGRLPTGLPAPAPAPFGLPAPRDPRLADLGRGLGCYALSIIATSASERAQRIYAGNVLLAAHEQRSADESIVESLRLPIRRILHPSINLSSKRDARCHEVGPGRRREIEERLVHVLTHRSIGTVVGGRWMPVGTPVRGGPTADLRAVTAADEVGIDPCVADVAARFPRRRAVRCWASFTQRMGLLAEALLVHHGDQLGSALDEAQVAAILADAATAVPSVPTRPTPPPVSDALSARLDALRQRADPVADAAVAPQAAQIASAPSIRAALALCYPSGGTSPGDEPWPDPFPDITADSDARWNSLRAAGLIDGSTLRQAIDLYRTHLVPINAALLFSSLPDSYAADHGVRVLARVSALGSTPVRRTGETAGFLLTVLLGDLDDAGSPARRAVVGVRRFHAAMRVMFRPGTWPHDVLGRPINQEDLLGTMLAFVVPVFETFERLGLDVDVDARNAYSRTWCAIGYLLGVEGSLLVRGDGGDAHLLTAAEAAELAAVIRHRQQRRNLDGTWLLEALMDDVADHFPAGMGSAPDALLRLLGGDDIATTLLADRRQRDLITSALGAGVRALRAPVVRRSMPVLLEWTAAQFLREFVEQDFSRDYFDGHRHTPSPPTTRLPIGCLDEPPASTAVDGQRISATTSSMASSNGPLQG